MSQPSTPTDSGPVARMLAVLNENGPGVHVLARDLAAAAGLTAERLSALMRWHVSAGHVIKAGRARRATYGLPGAQSLRCQCCGQDRPETGGAFVTGTGWACADCVTELTPSGPRRAERSPEGRPPDESPEPWRPHSAPRPLSAPALPATGANVTRDERMRLGRYGVHPSEVTPLFSALGPGRYLDGERA